MVKQHNILELNGRKYDALTGRLLEKTISKPAPAQINEGKITSTPNNAHQLHKKPLRSRTLMRPSVQKTLITPPANTSPPKPVSGKNPRTMDIARAKRASNIPRNALIQRYGSHDGYDSRMQASNSRQESSGHQPAVRHTNQEVKKHPHPSHVTDKSQNSNDLLEKALKNARSHEEPLAPKTKSRHKLASKLRLSSKAAGVMTTVLAFVVLGGFFAYQNMPNLAFKLAATRSGLDAGLPGYSPSGFKLAMPIQYSAGYVELNYQSNSDERNFKIVQQKSDWSSEALLDGYVATSGNTYQTYQDKGRTIYIYDNNATWVSGGVWYQVEGSSSLNSDQLLRIASSL